MDEKKLQMVARRVIMESLQNISAEEKKLEGEDQVQELGPDAFIDSLNLNVLASKMKIRYRQ